MWNKSTSYIKVYIQKWFHDEQGDKIPENFNVSSMIRNDLR